MDYFRNQKLNKVYNNTRLAFLEFIKYWDINEEEIINTKPDSSDGRYLKVDLTNWSQQEKERLFTDFLTGVYYYHIKYSQKKSFDFGTY